MNAGQSEDGIVRKGRRVVDNSVVGGGAQAAFAKTMADVPADLLDMPNTAPMWFWATDAEHRFTGFSNHMAQFTCADPRDYIGRSRRDFILGLTAYTPEGEAHLRCLDAHEPFRDFTYRHVFPGRPTLWVSSSGDPVFGAAGRFCGYRGVAMVLSNAVENANQTLMSERTLLARTAELQQKVEAHTAALDTSYRLLSGVLETMDQGLIVYDQGADGELAVVLSNPRFCELMDLPPDLARQGSPLSRIFDYCDARGDFDSLPKRRESLREASDAGRPFMLHPGISGRSVMYHTVRRSDTAALVTLTDVTEIEVQNRALNRARERAQTASDLLSEVVEAMGEGLLVTGGSQLTDEDKVVEVVNPAYRKLFGLSEDEIAPGHMMRDVLKVLRNRGDALSRDEFAVLADRMSAGEQATMRVQSAGRVCSVRATPRPSGGFVLVHSDVTDLQARADALETARRGAELASKAKSAFLAVMSHKIRTPMNGIIGMAEVLIESGLSREQESFARTILDSGVALGEVIGDVLDFSKIEAGKVELVEGMVELTMLVRDVWQLMSPRATAAGLDLRLPVAPGMAGHWQGDGTRLRQILLNLVGNAIKFTPAGHVEIRLLPRPGGGVVFEVEDTGVGIAPERQATVFEAFDQVISPDGRHHGGTGLGLEITRRLVNLMGGILILRSEVGVGSVFVASLPLAEASAPLVTNAVGPVPRPATPMVRRHILIAEDNRTNQLVLRHMLAPLCAELTLCKDGVEAVAAFARGGVNLVLMDVSMPRLDGIAATRHIRLAEAETDARPVPIIALTGNVTAEDRNLCMNAGMNGFLTKPLRKATVLAEIARFLPDADADEPAPRKSAV